MKILKKLVALALVLAAVLSIGVTAQAASTTTMYVNVPQGPGYTVNVRASESTSSTKLDAITYGSAVYVTSKGSTWCHVNYVNPSTGKTINGYIMTEFLSTSIPHDCYWMVRYGLADIKNGSNSTYVKNLQEDLNTELKINLTIDGKVGPATLSAIKQFQQKYGLDADGVAGNRTKEWLFKKAN